MAVIALVRIVLAYIVVTGGPLTHEYAARFVGSYLTFPPGVEHETVIACNGGPPTHDTGMLFAPLNAKFLPRINDLGFDITGYMDVAQRFPCDLLLACGETIHFHREGWLAKYVEAASRHGPGMYGTFTSFLVRPHLNTTGFCVTPKFLLDYPRPQSRQDRYAFEHGHHSLWRTIAAHGYATKLVTFDGVYGPEQWRTPPNILWRGDQSNCLMLCSHTDRWFEQDEKKRSDWSKGADGVYKTIAL